MMKCIIGDDGIPYLSAPLLIAWLDESGSAWLDESGSEDKMIESFRKCAIKILIETLDKYLADVYPGRRFDAYELMMRTFK